MTHPAIDSIKRILALALLLSSTSAFAQNVTKLAPSLPGPPRLLPISDSRVAALVEKNKKFPTTKGFRDLSELYLALNRPGGKVAQPTLVEAVTP